MEKTQNEKIREDIEYRKKLLKGKERETDSSEDEKDDRPPEKPAPGQSKADYQNQTKEDP
jgi:hypothetical protein